MTRIIIVEDGEATGYIDVDSLETNYTGDDDMLQRELEKVNEGISIGPPPTNFDGPNETLSGDNLVDYITALSTQQPFDFDYRIREDDVGDL